MNPLLKSAVLVVLFGAALSPLGCSTALKRVANATTAEQAAQQCYDDVEKHRPDEAIRKCSEAIAIQPNSGTAYYYRATAYELNGDVAQEKLDLDRAIAFAPAFAMPYAMRCVLEMTGDVNEQAHAKEDCDEAIRLSPRDQYIFGKRLLFRLHNSDYKGALADAQSVAILRPHSAISLVLACKIYVRMGRFSDARHACDQAKNADNDKDFAYRYVAIPEAQMGDWAIASADADRGVALKPDNPWGYDQRCWLRVHMNDLEGADKDCHEALMRSSYDPVMRDTRTKILFDRRDYQGVITEETAVVSLLPREPNGFGGRCAAEEQRRELVMAFKDCQRAVALDPNDGTWYVLRGNVYRAEGKTQLAHADYKHAWLINPSAIEALREQAKLELAAGDARSASTLAATYVAKNGYDPVGHEVYGKALVMLGRDSEAMKQLGAALAGYQQRRDKVGIDEVEVAMAPLKRSAHQ